jgi:hypothetical protein
MHSVWVGEARPTQGRDCALAEWLVRSLRVQSIGCWTRKGAEAGAALLVEADAVDPDLSGPG